MKEMTHYAKTLTKNDILTHYAVNYNMDKAELDELSEMNVTELRELFVQGESY